MCTRGCPSEEIEREKRCVKRWDLSKNKEMTEKEGFTKRRVGYPQDMRSEEKLEKFVLQ